MNITLPSIHTFPGSIPSPSPSPVNDDSDDFTTKTQNKKIDAEYVPPALPFPLSTPRGARISHARRVSTCSTSSAPPLSYSPSPSPPPARRPSCQDNMLLLVPCTMQSANAVVIVAADSESSGATPPTSVTRRGSLCTPPDTPTIYRPCKASESRATLLIGPAISNYGRKSAAARMHPYRIVRDLKMKHV